MGRSGREGQGQHVGFIASLHAVEGLHLAPERGRSHIVDSLLASYRSIGVCKGLHCTAELQPHVGAVGEMESTPVLNPVLSISREPREGRRVQFIEKLGVEAIRYGILLVLRGFGRPLDELLAILSTSGATRPSRQAMAPGICWAKRRTSCAEVPWPADWPGAVACEGWMGGALLSSTERAADPAGDGAGGAGGLRRDASAASDCLCSSQTCTLESHLCLPSAVR